MPVKTIPLCGNPTRRGNSVADIAATDQIYRGVIFNVVNNPIAGTKSVFVKKRGGLSANFTSGAAANGAACFWSKSKTLVISAWGLTTSTIYYTTSNIGTITTGYHVQHINEFFTSSYTEGGNTYSDITFWLFTCIDSTAIPGGATEAYYMPSANLATVTYTGDTHSNTTIDNMPSTLGMFRGMPISGSGIPAGTRISSVDSTTAITITAAATATAAGVTLTKGLLAKILSANFPAKICGQFQVLNGRVFIMTQNGRVYQSNFNSVSLYSDGEFFTCNMDTDLGIGLGKYKDQLWAGGNATIEVLDYTDNPSGSALKRNKEASFNISVDGVDSATSRALIASGNGIVAWIIFQMQKLYVFDGKLRDISLPIMTSMFAVADILNLSIVNMLGQTFIHFSHSINNQNMLYSLEYDMWVEANFPGAMIFDDSNTSGYCVAENLTDGIIYLWSKGVIQDNSLNFQITLQTEPLYLNDGKGFILNSIDLIGDTQPSGSSELYSSSDDYANFGQLGSFDLTSQVKRIEPGGFYDSHVIFKITDSGNNQWRAQALKINWDNTE